MFTSGVCTAYVGYVDLPVKRLVSATVPITNDFGALSFDTPCVSLYNVGLQAVSQASPHAQGMLF